MSKESAELQRILNDHDKRLARLEAAVLQRTASKGTKSAASQSATHASLPKQLLALRDAGFFAKPRTAEDSHEKLLPTYHCELNRVEVALVRLAKGRKLRRATVTGNGRGYQAYVW